MKWLVQRRSFDFVKMMPTHLATTRALKLRLDAPIPKSAGLPKAVLRSWARPETSFLVGRRGRASAQTHLTS